MFIDKYQTKEITLNILVEMEKSERDEILNYLTREQHIEVFEETVTLTKLLKLKRSGKPGIKNKEKFEHLQKFPKGRFWDYPEFRLNYGSEPLTDVIAFAGDEPGDAEMLVSSKGDVVHLDIGGSDKLIIYSAGDVDNSINKARKIELDGEVVKVGELIACTFLEYIIDWSLFDKKIIHKNGLKWDDHWSNLQFGTDKRKVNDLYSSDIWAGQR